MTRRTAILNDQPSLWDDPAPRPAEPAPRVSKLERQGHPKPPRRDKEWNELTPCAPRCLACRKYEPAAEAPIWPLCPATRSRCATVCAHTNDAYKTDICVITTHVNAVLMTLPYSGRTIAAVTCPHCGGHHAHDPTPGSHYRTSKCRTGRKPYIIHTPEGA